MLALLVTVRAALLLVACDEKKAVQEPPPPAPAVGVAPAAIKGVAQPYNFVGRIKAINIVQMSPNGSLSCRKHAISGSVTLARAPAPAQPSSRRRYVRRGWVRSSRGAARFGWIGSTGACARTDAAHRRRE
jgi:hypothetical protein